MQMDVTDRGMKHAEGYKLQRNMRDVMFREMLHAEGCNMQMDVTGRGMKHAEGCNIQREDNICTKM
jgi:hypothetical protein